MATEKKLDKTRWNTEKQAWEIYTFPEAVESQRCISESISSDHTKITIDASVAAIVKKVTHNPTYVEFSGRTQDNYEAVSKDEKKTRQKEAGYWLSKVSDTASTALVMASAVILYFRNSVPADTSDEVCQNTSQPYNATNASNTGQEDNSYMTVLSNISLPMTIGLSLLAQAVRYWYIWGIDDEKKEKQLYEIMQKFMEKLNDIRNEIQKKENIVSALLDYCGINIDKIDVKAVDNQIISKKVTTEEGFGDEAIKLNDLRVWKSLYDPIFECVDAKRDMSVYEKLDDTIKVIESSVSNKIEKDKMKAIILNLLKIIVGLSDGYNKVESKKRAKIMRATTIDSFLNLMYSTSNSKIFNHVLELFENKNRLLIIYEIVALLSYKSIKTFDPKNINSSPLRKLYSRLSTENFLRFPHKLENIYQDLHSLDDEKKEIFVDAFEENFKKDKSVFHKDTFKLLFKIISDGKLYSMTKKEKSTSTMSAKEEKNKRDKGKEKDERSSNETDEIEKGLISKEEDYKVTEEVKKRPHDAGMAQSLQSLKKNLGFFPTIDSQASEVTTTTSTALTNTMTTLPTTTATSTTSSNVTKTGL